MQMDNIGGIMYNINNVNVYETAALNAPNTPNNYKKIHSITVKIILIKK